MAKYIFLLSFFLYFNSNAQSYIGKSKKEILQLVQKDFTKDAKLSFNSNLGHPYIEVTNDYETLYYYLEEDICVRFVVWKPYSCGCLETDIKAYNENLISNGDLEWKNKEESKVYTMSLHEDNYSLRIEPYQKPTVYSSTSQME